MSISAKLQALMPSSKAIRWGFILFLSALLFVNAAYTFAFGYSFAGSLLGAPLLGGLIMLLFFDGGAFAWYVARAKLAGNSNQTAVAWVMSIGTLIASTLVSIMQIVMEVGKFDAAVDYWVGLSGVIILCICTVANFAAAYAWNYYDPQEQEAATKRAQDQLEKERENEIIRTGQQQRNDLISEAQEDAYKKAADAIHKAKPIISSRLAKESLIEYFRAVGMDDLIDEFADAEQKALSATTPPPRAMTEAELNVMLDEKLRKREEQARRRQSVIDAEVAKRLKAERKAAKKKGKKKKSKGGHAGAKAPTEQQPSTPPETQPINSTVPEDDGKRDTSPEGEVLDLELTLSSDHVGK